MKVNSDSGPLLSLCLTANYPGRPGVLRDLRLTMQAGEVLGLVGQSGSGKSTIALSIMRLLDAKGGTAAGSVSFQGRDLMAIGEAEMRAVRGRQIALVLQSPLSALNPAMRIGAQLGEAWRAHRGPQPAPFLRWLGWNARGRRHDCRRALTRALAETSLPADDAFLRRYPDQMSVGQAQRVLIAMALLHRPSLLIADEPTSALDLITQAEILNLFRTLNRSHGVAILYISHDLASIASICDRIAILHQGQIVECAATQQIFQAPSHSYTAQLIAALPAIAFHKDTTLA